METVRPASLTELVRKLSGTYPSISDNSKTWSSVLGKNNEPRKYSLAHEMEEFYVGRTIPKPCNPLERHFALNHQSITSSLAF